MFVPMSMITKRKMGKSLVDDSVWQWEGSPWKSRSAYFGYIRGGIRRGLWNRHPSKIQFLNSVRIKIDNPNPKNATRFPKVWGCQCNVCKGIFTMKDIEVDHIEGNHSLRTFEDISKFIQAIVTVKPDDLQAICKDCHKTKSLSDAQGISFEEARATRVAIELIKTKQDKTFLESKGLTVGSNQKTRREQIIKYLMEEGFE